MVANNAWRVIRLFVDLRWNVAKLVEWHVRSIRQIEAHIKEVYEANKQIVNFLESTTLLRHYAMITNAGARLKKFIIHTLQLFPKSKESTIAEPQANIIERKSEIGYYIHAASTKTRPFRSINIVRASYIPSPKQQTRYQRLMPKKQSDKESR